MRSGYPVLLGILISGVVVPFWASAQPGATTLDTVQVRGSIPLAGSIQSLPLQRIEQRLAGDAGQLMTLFPGVQLRSYGGIGGMKTVSFRSLGAGHTSVVRDYFALSTTQSGMTDLGQIPVDFIHSLSLVNMAGTSLNYPIQSKLAGQIIAIETRQLPRFHDTLQFVCGSQLGSFGQADLFSLIQHQRGRWSASVSVKGRTFTGNYPFSYQNGSTQVAARRTNGDLQELYGTATISYQPSDKNSFHAAYSGAGYDKGLPGAVVFYNETAGQRLFGNNHLASVRHLWNGGKWQGASTASFQQAGLDYVDSNYLNAQGYLHNHYLSKQVEGQTQWSGSIRSAKVLMGAGGRYEQLESEAFTSIPKRYSADGILAASVPFKGTISAQLGFQGVQDFRQTNSRQTVALLPSIEWTSQPGKARIFAFGYRYTVRQPSFNELYYNQLGNEDLRPEKAQLGFLRLGWGRHRNSHNLRITLQPFYTYVTDKILAIPTKNLFVWSIQNIGKSQALGTEFTANFSIERKNNRIAVHLNYTFQYTQDLSDPQGTTYGHILSYSPLHSGTTELSFGQAKWGLSTLLTYQGERYALNENIPANLLDDFLLIDLSGWYKLPLKKHKLIVRAALNNLTNNYYSYIRYFVMPGTNFTIRLSYEW